MRKFTNIDNEFCSVNEITIQEAVLLDWMMSLPSWSSKLIFENDVYYFASRHKACDDLKLLTDKPDTMYRYYKKLEEKGIVELKKFDNKDYIRFLAKCRLWNSNNHTSEQSEKNPTLFGNKSENDSEKNPTDSKNSLSDSEVKIDFKRLLDFFNMQTGKKSRVINETVKRSYRARIREGYTKMDIINSIQNAVKNEYHRNTNFQHLTLEFFSRSKILDKYSQSVKVVDTQNDLEQMKKDGHHNF